MPFVNENDLAKAIRAGDIAPLYFFFGKDTATLEAYTKKLIAKLVKKDAVAYNLHAFYGKSLDISELADVCEALPMFADRVCISINDLNAEDLNAEDFAFLMSLLSDLPDTTTVIIYATGIDLLNGKKTLIGKNKKLSDLATKIGLSCDFSYKTTSQLSKIIIDKFEKNGCSISKKNAEKLAELCLCNLLMINSEIEKLSAYSNGGEITADELELLVTRQLDSNAFALAKSLAGSNSKRAMMLLDELYYQQVEPIIILSSVAMSFTDLYRARTAIDSGLLADDVVRDFSYKGREFAVRNAFSDCRGISAKRLRECIQILADTDIALKSSRTQPRLLLEQAFVEILAEKS